jgi:hypothetical protein
MVGSQQVEKYRGKQTAPAGGCRDGEISEGYFPVTSDEVSVLWVLVKGDGEGVDNVLRSAIFQPINGLPIDYKGHLLRRCRRALPKRCTEEEPAEMQRSSRRYRRRTHLELRSSIGFKTSTFTSAGGPRKKQIRCRTKKPGPSNSRLLTTPKIMSNTTSTANNVNTKYETMRKICRANSDLRTNLYKIRQ